MSKEQIGVLYLNITIRDGSEAVKASVAKKLQNSRLPRKVKNLSAQTASDFASPRMVAQQLSQTMMKQFPKKMKEKGLTVELEEVYKEGAYVVLQLQVTHVDTVRLTMKGNKDDPLNYLIHWAMMMVTTTGNQKHMEEVLLPKQVMKYLAVEMPNILEEKIASKKVEAETKVCDGKEQARYFYNKLKEIRQNRTRLQKFRHRMSSSLTSYEEVFEEEKATADWGSTISSMFSSNSSNKTT